MKSLIAPVVILVAAAAALLVGKRCVDGSMDSSSERDRQLIERSVDRGNR